MATPARAHALNEEHGTLQNPDAPFPPGQFFREVGVVLAVCLGLAALAHVLVIVIGAQ